MKKIVVIVAVLFIAILTMAYLYFSSLNSEQKNNDSSLYAATLNSGFVFSFQNDKSIMDILKGQNLFSEIAGENKYAQLVSLKTNLLAMRGLNQLIGQQNIYISLIAGKDKNIDFLYTTIMNHDGSKRKLLTALTSAGIKLDTAHRLTRITLADSTVFYLGIKDHLLLLSAAPKPVTDVLSAAFKSNKFVDYIKSNSRLAKNSLAEVYINYATLPALLDATMPGKLNGELSVLSKQNAFASLVYNFSENNMLLTGPTTVNNPHSYYQLFAGLTPQKTTINNILPENTANYSVFLIDHYNSWKKSLDQWFSDKKEIKKVAGIIKGSNSKYHIDLDQVFPKYFKNQLLTFQLSTTEKIGAINLTNGDKVRQLLLDLSGDYADDIKIFKDAGLLYCYFGEPFAKFQRPFYTIIDNYMIFANNASTVQSFLNSYKNNKLLINNYNYTTTINQLPDNSSISFFISIQNSRDIFRRNIYLPYYRNIVADKGLKNYSSFVYQLSGDEGKFQTNVLINKELAPVAIDSLTIVTDSLMINP